MIKRTTLKYISLSKYYKDQVHIFDKSVPPFENARLKSILGIARLADFMLLSQLSYNDWGFLVS